VRLWPRQQPKAASSRRAQARERASRFSPDRSQQVACQPDFRVCLEGHLGGAAQDFPIGIPPQRGPRSPADEHHRVDPAAAALACRAGAAAASNGARRMDGRTVGGPPPRPDTPSDGPVPSGSSAAASACRWRPAGCGPAFRRPGPWIEVRAARSRRAGPCGACSPGMKDRASSAAAPRACFDQTPSKPLLQQISQLLQASSNGAVRRRGPAANTLARPLQRPCGRRSSCTRPCKVLDIGQGAKADGRGSPPRHAEAGRDRCRWRSPACENSSPGPAPVPQRRREYQSRFIPIPATKATPWPAMKGVNSEEPASQELHVR